MKQSQNLVKQWEKFESASYEPGTISFTSGRPSPEVYPFALPRIKKFFTGLLKTEILDYGPPAGIDKLRKLITEKYQGEGVKASINNVIITSGSQQSLDLVLKALLKPSEKIMLENQNYTGIQQSILNRGAKMVLLPKPFIEFGHKKFEAYLKKSKIKIFYLSPEFANPTGYTLLLEKRQELIEFSKKYNFLILEDQAYRDLVYEENDQLPSLKALDSNVISVGTVTKTIVPGLRVGWIATPNRYFEAILDQKKACDLFTPSLNQEVIAEFIKDQKFFSQHLKKIRNYYQEKMIILQNTLDRNMPSSFSWNKPVGGFFVWVKGPKKLNSEKLFNEAIKNKVAFMPGFVFYYRQPEFNTFRLSISTTPKNKVEPGIFRLAKTIKGEKEKISIQKKCFLAKSKSKLKRLIKDLIPHQ